MSNTWFFNWHHIGGDRPVRIDSFDGREICYSGIEYDGTAQIVYWDTIQRYLRQQIVLRIHEIETEIGSSPNYPSEAIKNTLNEAQHLLTGFAQRIRNKAIEKDRVLRSDGINFPPSFDRGDWEGGRPEQIAAQIDALRDLLLANESKPSPIHSWYLQHKWWVDIIGWMLGFTVAVAGLVLAT